MHFLASLLRYRWLIGAIRFFVIGLLLGWIYDWAGPRLYPAEKRFGFLFGMAHGACMPMALPALIMGNNVKIYSEHNTGRSYKLGYITGINLCGLVFFGGSFWQPGRKGANGRLQNHQVR